MMGEPEDYSGRYNTVLTPQEEVAFQAWAAKAGRLKDVYDYDLRGAWRASAQEAANGHLPDTFKKPNHPTFSNESQYNGVDGFKGGEWLGDDKAGWSYLPSETNTKFYPPTLLQDYFRSTEPDAKLILSPNSPLAAVDAVFP
jgi:hypothetical protein